MIDLERYAKTDRPVSTALPADDARTLCLVLTLADAGMPHRVHVVQAGEDGHADAVRQARSLDPDAFDARHANGVARLTVNLATADVIDAWKATASDPQYDEVRAFVARQSSSSSPSGGPDDNSSSTAPAVARRQAAASSRPNPQGED